MRLSDEERAALQAVEYLGLKLGGACPAHETAIVCNALRSRLAAAGPVVDETRAAFVRGFVEGVRQFGEGDGMYSTPTDAEILEAANEAAALERKDHE